MSVRVRYDQHRGEYLIVVTLDAEEARNIADALGSRDGAHKELHEAADQADRSNQEVGS